MIQNTNGQISWKKLNCNEYSVTNHTEKTVMVEITSETNEYTASLEVEPDVTAEFELPCDGVFKICIEGETETIVVNTSEDVLAVETVLSVYTFTGVEPIEFELLTFNGNVIYDKFLDGPSNTDTFPTVPNQQNFLATLVATLGSGNFHLVGPGGTPIAAFLPLGVDAVNWRLILQHPTQQGNLLRIKDNTGFISEISPSFYCRYDLANYTGSNAWVTSLLIEGVDVLATPSTPFRTRYDQTNGADVSAFTSHLATYLTDLGFPPLITSFPWNIIILDDDLCCPDVEQITYADITILCDPIVWCDYLYELCSLYTCILAKLRDYMCGECDPCKTDCSNVDIAKANKAKEDLMYINALFTHGLVPLITKDRLNYMGDLVIDESRVECTMKLKEIYEKLVDFVTRCGECEECDCAEADCGCGCCEPSTTNCNNC